jgi:HECT-domain (ubiquitin-transferase)/WD domain, G-beta repeat
MIAGENGTEDLKGAALVDPVKVLQEHTGIVRTMIALEGGKLLASAGDDAVIRIWDIKTGICINKLQGTKKYKGHTGSIQSIILLENGGLASGGHDEKLVIWEKKDNSFVISKEHSLGFKIKTIAELKTKGKLIVGGESNIVKIINIKSSIFGKEDFMPLYKSVEYVESIKITPNNIFIECEGKKDGYERRKFCIYDYSFNLIPMRDEQTFINTVKSKDLNLYKDKVVLPKSLFAINTDIMLVDKTYGSEYGNRTYNGLYKYTLSYEKMHQNYFVIDIDYYTRAGIRTYLFTYENIFGYILLESKYDNDKKQWRKDWYIVFLNPATSEYLVLKNDIFTETNCFVGISKTTFATATGNNIYIWNYDPLKSLHGETRRRSRIASKAITQDEEEMMSQNGTCSSLQTYSQLTEELQPFTNKLRRLCQIMVDKDKCDLKGVNDRAMELANKYSKTGFAVKFVVKRGDEFSVFFNEWNKWLMNKSYNILEIPLKNFEINYKGEDGIDAGGLRRSFFQEIVNHISKTFFTKLSEKSDVYTFNHAEIGKLGPNNLGFQFLGSFVAWMIINRLNFNFHINKAILANLLYKDYEKDKKDNELTFEDYALFYVLDDPDAGISLLNTMLYPDYIKEGNLEFNTEEMRLRNSSRKSGPNEVPPPVRPMTALKRLTQKFVKTNKVLPIPSPPKRSSRSSPEKSNTVDLASYREYVGLYSRYKLIGDNYKALSAFKKGFYIEQSFMRNRKYTVMQLDALITTVEMSDENIETLANIINPPHAAKNYEERLLKDIRSEFANIVRGKVTIPVDSFDSNEQKALQLPEDYKTNPEAQKNYHKRIFLPRLLGWFTGVQNFDSLNPNKYTISMSPSQQETQLPVAHTCSYNIEMPSTILVAKGMMYKLTYAILNSKGFQIG